MADGPSAIPPITVVVVARNEERGIAACVRSLAAQDYPNFSVILVDDGSTDATVAIAREIFPSIRIISSPTRSISRNRDLAWRAAETEFVAFLDADCEAPSHWLSALVAAVLSTGAAAVGGGNEPPRETSHYEALRLMLQTFLGSRGSIQGRIPDRGRYVTHLPGLNVLYRTDALALVGGYDPRFARMGEDEDLSHRLGDVGLKLYVTPDATVIHRQRPDLISWTRNMRAYGRGRTWLLRRHPNAFSLFFLLPPLTIPALPIYLSLIVAFAGWVALRGGRLDLWPRLFLLFAATHLAYGLGQIEGLFVRGDNEAARRKYGRIALIALKNAGNKGDEAISSCVSARVTEAIDRCSASADLYLAALGPSGFDIRPVPKDGHARDMLIGDMLAPSTASRQVDEAALLAIPRLIAVLVRFRAIVIAGGQWLHDLSFLRHLGVCGVFAFARMCGTKTGVFCIGAGPLRRTLSRGLLRLAFSRDSFIVTRDVASTGLLQRSGLKQAQTATDPAIELTSREAPDGAGSILISPCAWSSFDNLYALDSSEIEASFANWRKLISALLDRGERVTVLPTMNPEDTAFSERLITGFEGVDVIDTNRFAPGQVQGVIEEAKAIVSMRLHPIIFASNVGTPFVALAYAAKVSAYCEQAGLGSRVVRLQADDWVERVLNLLDSIPDRQSACEARVCQQESLTRAYSEFFNWLRLSPAPVRSVTHQADNCHEDSFPQPTA
jgi:polysaccharide pyruvyl transferase WcaK-like protein/GT2 family glycosyltransferase